ncbi:NfeD family protein [Methyloraptor flagellatus]|uniref:NfeD family protein n=1 Tax=Methyloraptor flagellatus TaxID=3162530 RepID=A0AAU7XC28_9HYPH
MGLIETAFTQYGAWSWWVLGLALLALEVLAPGAFFLWFGIAAFVVGALAFAVTLSWQTSTLIWIGLTIVFLLYTWVPWRRRDRLHETRDVNERSRRYIGRVFTLAEPIVENSGRLSIDDTIWRISGPDLPAGARVRISGADGAVLKVDSAT